MLDLIIHFGDGTWWSNPKRRVLAKSHIVMVKNPIFQKHVLVTCQVFIAKTRPNSIHFLVPCQILMVKNPKLREGKFLLPHPAASISLTDSVVTSPRLEAAECHARNVHRGDQSLRTVKPCYILFHWIVVRETFDRNPRKNDGFLIFVPWFSCKPIQWLLGKMRQFGMLSIITFLLVGWYCLMGMTTLYS